MPLVDFQTLAHDPRIILKVRLVTHTLGEASPTTSDNHWSIFLIISEKENEEDSVRVNMSAPDYEKLTGELQWGDHNYVISNSAVAYWDCSVVLTSEFTVASAVSLLFGLGRDDYEMSGGGSGCRWWCYTILCDLADWGYIHSSEPARIRSVMDYQYHKTLAPKFLAMPEGEFSPRVIAQPPVYRFSNPPRELVPFAINGQQKWTLLADWVQWDDHNGIHYLRNYRYNLSFYYPTSFQYITANPS